MGVHLPVYTASATRPTRHTRPTITLAAIPLVARRQIRPRAASALRRPDLPAEELAIARLAQRRARERLEPTQQVRCARPERGRLLRGPPGTAAAQREEAQRGVVSRQLDCHVEVLQAMQQRFHLPRYSARSSTRVGKGRGRVQRGVQGAGGRQGGGAGGRWWRGAREKGVCRERRGWGDRGEYHEYDAWKACTSLADFLMRLRWTERRSSPLSGGGRPTLSTGCDQRGWRRQGEVGSPRAQRAWCHLQQACSACIHQQGESAQCMQRMSTIEGIQIAEGRAGAVCEARRATRRARRP